MRKYPGLMLTALLVLMTFLSGCATIFGKDEGGPGDDGPLAIEMEYPYDMYVDGQPDFNRLPITGGFYIWKTGNVWHMHIVRVYKPRTSIYEPIFTGTVRVERAVITRTKRNDLEVFDDLFARRDDITFKMELKNRPKGFDFEVRPTGMPEYCVTFDLQVNRVPAPDLVFIGRSIYAPNKLPLRICFH